MPVRSWNTGRGGSSVLPGTDKLDRWAAKLEASQMPLLYDRPMAMLPTVFPDISTTGARYQMLRDIGADPLVLYLAMMGNQMSAGAVPSVEHYVNWLGDFYKMLGTPGGRVIDPRALIRNVFNANVSDAGLTQLGALLTAGDPSTQLSALFNVLRDITNAATNPLSARAYQAALARAGEMAINRLITGKGTNAPLFQLVKQIMPSLAVV